MKRKCLAVGIIFLFIGTAIIPSSGQKGNEKPSLPVSAGKTIYVDDDNVNGPWDGTREHPFRTVSDAYEKASDGDTIFVFNGDYWHFPYLILEKSLTLQGENPAATQLRMTINVKKDNIVIENFTQISDGISSWGIGIWSNGNTIQNNIIISATNGIEFIGGSKNLIQSNIFKNCSWNGVALLEGDKNIIKNNTFYNNHNSGVSLANHQLNVIQKNCIIKNKEGIEIRGNVDHALILDNNISDNLDCGIDFEDENTKNIIVDNTLIHNKNFGIYLVGTKNIIYRNTISQSNCGIFLKDGGNFIVSNNLIDNNQGASFEYNGYPFTLWLRNYWDRPHALPKPILGKMIFTFGYYPPKQYTVPWFNLDLRPRLLPVNIT